VQIPQAGRRMLTERVADRVPLLERQCEHRDVAIGGPLELCRELGIVNELRQLEDELVADGDAGQEHGNVCSTLHHPTRDDEEIAEVRWATVAELETLDLMPSTRHILACVAAGHSFDP
jgi:hypothetical protein